MADGILAMTIQIKRVYESAERSDGYRILVDRLWPRGLSKEQAAVDEWLRDIAPSGELRHWFSHQVEHWTEFEQRYREELHQEPALGALHRLCERASQQQVTLLYAARDVQYNNAVALLDCLKTECP